MADLKKKLLLVEDDETFRKVVKNALELLSYDVREAENGLVAQTIFDLNPESFEIIISDIRMRELDGVTFLRHVRNCNKNVKFILMTGFNDVLEAEAAYELGANEFMTKPFRIENLRKVIAACYEPRKPKTTSPPEEEEERFCRIPVEEFITASKLLVDLHVKLSGEKFIKIAHAGDVVPVERLKTYKEKKVDFFYVKPEELRQLVGLNLKLNKAANSVQVSRKAKRKLLKNTATLITQSYYFNGVDREGLKHATEIIDSTLEMISEDPSIMALLEFLQSGDEELYAHTVAVSVYSCMMGKALGHASTTVQTRLAMGGILHDIGKKELPRELLNKKRFEMNADEIALYESHPQRGKDILSQIAGVPEDVIQIAAHHHENNVGTGFPYHLSGNRIHPLAKIVSVSDCFISMLFRMGVKNAVDVKEAIQKLGNLHALEYDQNIVRALASLFGPVGSEKRAG